MTQPTPNEPVILAIDQGTTGTTVLLVDETANVVARGYREVATSYPRPGWVEQDAENLWRRSLAADPALRTRAARGEIRFGTIDSWLVWKLTAGQAHRTDYTNASRTMLFNIHEKRWDDPLLQALDVPRAILPEVGPSSAIHGET